MSGAADRFRAMGLGHCQLKAFFVLLAGAAAEEEGIRRQRKDGII